MPAPRYENWHHLRVEGNKDAAAALLPLARKVLGYVVEQAQAADIGVLRRVYQVEGGHIIGELIGGQPRVTIVVDENPPNPEEPESQGGFLLWPRWDVVASNPDYPGTQVDPTGADPIAWLEFRGDGKVTRYWDRWDVVEDIEGARFERYNKPDLYPSSLHYYGNVEWKDGNDLSLSVYGYVSRYQRDVTLVDDGARWVFTQGQLLFDRIAYRDSLEAPPEYLSWRINSAGLRKSEEGFTEMLVAFTDYVTGRPTTAQSAFVAFRVNKRVGDPEKGNWTIEPESHVELGRTPGQINPDQPSNVATFADAAHPWFFNDDGTSAIRTVTTEQDSLGRVNTVTQTVSIGPESIEHVAVMADYMVGNYANSGSSFTLLQPARGLCASDYAGPGRKDAYISLRESYGTYVGPDNEPATLRVLAVLEFEGGELPLIDRTFALGNDVQDYHLLAFSDLRHNIFAGWRIQGANGLHTIQAFAYMGGRMEYGVVEDVSWLPTPDAGPAPFPGLDTRFQGDVLDGLVFGAFWTAAAGAGWGPEPGQGGEVWRRSPRTGLAYFSATTAVVAGMSALHGCKDLAAFNWPGGWNYIKGRYCVSMPGGYGAALNYLTGGNMGQLLGITADDRRFWPLTVLPKPI